MLDAACGMRRWRSDSTLRQLCVAVRRRTATALRVVLCALHVAHSVVHTSYNGTRHADGLAPSVPFRRSTFARWQRIPRPSTASSFWMEPGRRLVVLSAALLRFHWLSTHSTEYSQCVRRRTARPRPRAVAHSVVCRRRRCFNIYIYIYVCVCVCVPCACL